MKTVLTAVLIATLSTLPLAAFAQPTPAPAQSPPAVSTAKLAYKPPLRGAPAGRIGGGTRGDSERESFTLQVLAPDHVGYTVQEQPCLYWYISKSTVLPVELTVSERKAVEPLVEKALSGTSAGIHSVCLADLGVSLRKDIQYKWFVTLVADPAQRSRDIMAGGMVARIEAPTELAQKLGAAPTADLPGIYAGEGLWYDAMQSIAAVLDKAPDNPELRNQRSALLEQVGLMEIAEAEKQR